MIDQVDITARRHEGALALFRRSARAGMLGFAILPSLVLTGCNAAFYAHQDKLAATFAEGRFEQAAVALDQPEIKSLYGENNKLLYWLDRGSVALATDDIDRSIEMFERAEAFIETADRENFGNDLARWIVNDTAAPYFGAAYEDIYVNVFKLLAQLEAGRIDGGASVEARRANGKADVLRARYLRRTSDVATRDPQARAALDRSNSGRGQVVEQGQFIESTLGTFLAAVTFMKTGDRSFQSVAARRLESSIELQRSLQTGVSVQSFAGLGERDAASVNVLVVGLSGRGPTKAAETIGPIPIFEYPLYFQLPRLVGGSQAVGQTRLAVESAPAMPMVKIEDLRAVATENHRRELPLIYARTLIRATAKSLALYAGSKALQNNKRGDERDAIQIGTILGGITAMMLTEEADLRAWQFLPARADAALTRLPAGTHRVRVEFLSAGGGLLHAGEWQTIQVSDDPRALTTVVQHYWR
jgi:hypothetical protein